MTCSFVFGVDTEEIRRFCNDTHIEQISGDLGFVFTDFQCKDGDERFCNDASEAFGSICSF